MNRLSIRKNFISLILSVLSLVLFQNNESFASRARLLVTGSGEAGTLLGTGGNAGSLSTDSNYNIFYNPALIVESKNWITIEKSNAPGTTAQGGFSTSLMEKYYVSLFFNRIEGINTITQSSAGVGNNYSRRELMRPVDLTLGTMIGGAKIGLGATYSYYRLNNDIRDQDLNLKVGASYANIDPFFHYKVIGKNKTNTTDENRHRDLTGGIRYTWGEWSPYAAYSDYRINMPGTGDKYKTFGAGLARNSRLTESVNYVFSTGYWRSSRPVSKSNGNGFQTIVPVNIAAEADITTWLALRAGIGYNIVDANNTNSAADRTFGRIGSTLRFGSFSMDWVIGNNAVASSAVTEETAINAQAFDISNRFFSVASITYDW